MFPTSTCRSWRGTSTSRTRRFERMASFVIESRVLAGIQFLDIATGGPIGIPLHVRGVGGGSVVVRPNRRNIHVILAAEGFEKYVESFEAAPAAPAKSI